MAFQLVHDQEGKLLRGKQAAVVGLGKSGLSAIELCLARGARVRAADEKSEAELGLSAAALRGQGVELVLGGLCERSWRGADLVVVSPGVPLSTPALKAAREAGVPVFGEVELASMLVQRRAGPVIGITGTNGKSTTTALTGELFGKAPGRTFVGGNLGRPWSEAALDEQGFDAHVVELSSFMLEGIERARFNGAALLNLTPDHLDRYESHEAYGAAKARVFGTQGAGDFAVVNADDAAVMALAKAAKVPVYGFSTRGRPVAEGPALAGLAVPSGAGAFSFTFGDQERFRVENLALRGAHNLENAMAAALLARLGGVTASQVQAGLDSYPGLPHRLELARTLDGVEWVNDSKATNVDSTLVALKAFPGGLWVIAGGKGKGAPYLPMVEASRGRVKGVLTIGQDAPAIEAAYLGVAQVHPCGTLDRAIALARELAKAGEVVLLSPACASYDQFKNFEDRGDTFKRLVRAL
ncbi:MAG: UDP-N-acetylmuramoyl-L-alanine--D-glutamate ligase [Myxococcaceae bacterium]